MRTRLKRAVYDTDVRCKDEKSGKVLAVVTPKECSATASRRKWSRPSLECSQSFGSCHNDDGIVCPFIAALYGKQFGRKTWLRRSEVVGGNAEGRGSSNIEIPNFPRKVEDVSSGDCREIGGHPTPGYETPNHYKGVGVGKTTTVTTRTSPRIRKIRHLETCNGHRTWVATP